jgi:hypothetical protein
MEQRGEQSARAAQVAKLDSDAGVSSVTRSPTQISGSPGNRTLNLRIKSLLFSQSRDLQFRAECASDLPIRSMVIHGRSWLFIVALRPSDGQKVQNHVHSSNGQDSPIHGSPSEPDRASR